MANRIVEALHLENTPTAEVPATDFLPLDDTGPAATERYNYASVAGMMQYLAQTSRPDLCSAVSQISRYIYSPKRSHEIAMEQIGRYIKETASEGLILHPKRPASENNKHYFDIDVYVDADFASGWGTEDGTNPDSVKSRTRFVVEVMGFPII